MKDLLPCPAIFRESNKLADALAKHASRHHWEWGRSDALPMELAQLRSMSIVFSPSVFSVLLRGFYHLYRKKNVQGEDQKKAEVIANEVSIIFF